MNRIFTALTFTFCLTLSAFAQNEPKGDLEKNGGHYAFSFMRGKTFPSMSFLQGPPERGTYLWKNDSVMYEWGKSLRNTSRGDTAVIDGSVNLEFFMSRFGQALHKNITKESCPNLAKLIEGAAKDFSRSIDPVKRKVARHRPYQVFNQPSSIPQYERADDYTSYPSGHSVRAWGLALTFVALDSAHQDEIMQTGYDMCESRVIAGYHFESDVEAARLAASATFARLCAEPSFWAYLELAKQELAALAVNE